MTLTRRGHQGLESTRSLLNSLIELPDLARTIQALPLRTFAALVRKVGVEDAGELVALATTDQLVQAFDEDLFVSERAGQRETLDVGRFIVWLEVLLEAGDDVAADRVADLDEDFVAHAMGAVVLVLEEDALRECLDDGGEDESTQVDKALQSALTEDIDGYILVARQHDGWDTVLALVLALDRNHRALLVRLLDRLARVGSRYLDDLEELSSVLSEGEALAEDVESAREERRGKQGYVEARAAKAFLTLARTFSEQEERPADRDPLTRAYFRELDRGPSTALPTTTRALPPAIQRELDEASARPRSLGLTGSSEEARAMGEFMAALRDLGRDEPALFGERMEELAYLANVLLAGHERDGARLRPKAAADTALATVCYGAVLAARAARTTLAEVLRLRSVDLLFRTASGTLASSATPGVKSARKSGVLYSAQELEVAIRLSK